MHFSRVLVLQSMAQNKTKTPEFVSHDSRLLFLDVSNQKNVK